MAEPLGEQPIGSEVSSRPALRTYFIVVYFTGTPVNISELSGGMLGRGRSNWLLERWPLAASRPRFVGYTRCESFNMRLSCDSSRLGTEAFQETSARLCSGQSLHGRILRLCS